MDMNIDIVKKEYRSRREDGENFKALYRFSKENVQWLTSNFLPNEGDPRGGGLSNFQKMKTFLRYIGDPGFQVGIGEDIGIHQTTVCKVIWDVCQKIISKASRWIRFPSTDEELREAKMNWNATGAIDCTHVQIVRPHCHPDEFINRKGQASFNVQATCDANDIFTSVDCSWPGSVHDSRIWRNSEVYQVMSENTVGAFLLGDEGYGIAPWIMTPYRNPDSATQTFYNKLHCRERVGIERVFGQVKKRFPFL